MIEFLDELPKSATKSGRPKGAFRLALEANVGKWAEYPRTPKAAYRVAAQMSQNGSLFEAKTRGGVAYMRCVKL